MKKVYNPLAEPNIESVKSEMNKSLLFGLSLLIVVITVIIPAAFFLA